MDSTSALLIGKKLSGDITATEQQQLNELLEADTKLCRQLAVLEAFWHSKSPAAQKDPQLIQRLFHRIKQEEEPDNTDVKIIHRGRPRRWALLSAAAAAAVLLVTVAFYWFTNPAPVRSVAHTKPRLHNIETKPAYRTHMELLDGTKVWLNADSRISYGDDFNKQQRIVYLIGEAFFDVVSNPEKPFIIHTSKLNVKVTGTTLNVRAYPGEKVSETSLLEGQVEIQLVDDPEKIYFLKPAEKLVISNFLPEEMMVPAEKRKVIKVHEGYLLPEIRPITFDPLDSLPFETAWISHTLAFSNETFLQVARKLEKWYNVQIEFASPALENLRFSGRFEDETLEEALFALKIIGKFQYRILDKKVIVSP